MTAPGPSQSQQLPTEAAKPGTGGAPEERCLPSPRRSVSNPSPRETRSPGRAQTPTSQADSSAKQQHGSGARRARWAIGPLDHESSGQDGQRGRRLPPQPTPPLLSPQGPGGREGRRVCQNLEQDVGLPLDACSPQHVRVPGALAPHAHGQPRRPGHNAVPRSLQSWPKWTAGK